MRFYFYSAQNILVCTSEFSKKITAGQIFSMDMEQECQIFSLDGAGSLALTRQALIDKCNNQIKFYEMGQDVLCEIMPFACQGENVAFRLKTKYAKLYRLGNNSLLEISGRKCVVDARYGGFSFNSISFNKKDYYIIDNVQANWIIVLSEEDVVYNGRYIDYEVLKSKIKIYTHSPNVYNVGKIVQYDFNCDKKNIIIVKDKGQEAELISNEFIEVYFIEAILCGRTKLAYSRISYELKSSISEQVLADYFGEIDRYIYLPEKQVYITLKNNNIVGVYHIVVNNGWITSIY